MTPQNITWSTNPIDDGSPHGLVMSLPAHSTCLQAEYHCGQRGQGQVMVDSLPDNVLLEIFDFCRYPDSPGLVRFFSLPFWCQAWKILTQVCRRWRCIVLGSPRRLQLRAICNPKNPTRTLLDIWPPFPISIYSPQFDRALDERSVENLMVAVEHHDRISEIYIRNMNGPALERLTGLMYEPLLALTDLYLRSTDESVAVLPETFLGGFARRLQTFMLFGVPFPTFPKFVLFATNIVHLHLYDIPHSGYISPDAMVTCLATLPSLDYLRLGFRSPLSRPLRVALPPLTHLTLPALTSLTFKGASEYFEDFLARTHIPLLNHLEIQFFMDLIFDIPGTHRLIDREEELRPLGSAQIHLGWKTIAIKLGVPTRIQLEILCEERDWQLLSLAHVCSQHLPLSSVEWLTVWKPYEDRLFHLKDDMEPSQWLELLHPFIAVRTLGVSKKLVPLVTAALQELTGERTMEVLPILDTLFFEGFEPSGPMQEAIKPFVFARQLYNRPVIIRSRPRSRAT